MKRHFIPPNYNSSPFALFGFFKVSSLIESALIAIILFSLLDALLPAFSSLFLRELTISILTFICFILVFAVSSKESITSKILRRLKFSRDKRELIYRVPKRRAVLTSKDKTIDLKRIVNPISPSLKYQRYTQELIDIDRIEDGIIITKSGHFVKILELEACNFNSLKSEEMGAVLQDFASLLKIGPLYSQFKVISKPSDLSDYITRLRKKTSGESDERIVSLIEEVCKQLTLLSKETALEHRYFYIFSCKPNINDSFEKERRAKEKLRVITEFAYSYLAKRGVHIKIHGSGKLSDEDQFNRAFLYEFFNRKSIKSEGLALREAHLKEAGQKVIKDINLVAPRGISLKMRDYIVMDGLYYSYLFITGYPERGVLTGFMGKFINVGEGFDYDILIEREDKNEIRKKLKKRNLLSKTNADQMNHYTNAFSETKHIITATNYLLEMLEGDNEFFYVTVVATISAETKQKLEEKKQWLKNLLEGYNYKVHDPKYEMEDVFRVTNPLAIREPKFLERYHRNVLTDSLVSFYPLTTASISQIDGIAIGINEENHSPVILDVFNPVSNLFVFGMTGYGKSFLCMLLASRLRLFQTQVYVIAPIKAHEYRRLCECLDGSFIEIGPGSKDCINILEVRPMYRYERRDGEESGSFAESSHLNEKIQDLLRFFDLITENTLTREARDLLSPFLVAFYKRYGITNENSSIYIDHDSSKGLVKMPIIEDLRDALLESEESELRELARPLKKFTDGNLVYFNNETNVDLENKFCVIDMSKAIDYPETRNLVIYLVQNYVWSRVRADRTHRKAIVYEEIWKLLNSRESAETIREVFKTIRGFYGIAVGITQNLEDLTSNPYNVADGILNNTSIQLLMHNSSDEASKLQKRFGLTNYEYGLITGLECGKTLILTPEQHFKCQILATRTEGELFETDGNKLSGN